MYCPKCQAEFREGYYRCAKCDVELAEGTPETALAPPPRQLQWLSALRESRVEDWLKLGAYIYVAAEILGALVGRSGVFVIGPERFGGWGVALMTFAGSTLSAIIQGALYYGVGEIIGLLRRGAVPNGGE